MEGGSLREVRKKNDVLTLLISMTKQKSGTTWSSLDKVGLAEFLIGSLIRKMHFFVAKNTFS